jgi:aspartyl-tRNA synthetase
LSQQSKVVADIKTLRQQLSELEKKISKGTERLLLLDEENLADATVLLNQWRQQRAELEIEISKSLSHNLVWIADFPSAEPFWDRL